MAEQQQQQQRCLGGCGFFGHPSFMNYCSVCFKDKKGGATTPPPAATLAPLTVTPVAIVPPHKDDTPNEGSTSKSSSDASAQPLESSAATPVATAAVSAESSAPSTCTSSEAAAPSRPVQKNLQRCWSCNKRVGLLGFKCKCDYIFCSNHRHSHTHSCSFDYQQLARSELETRLGDAVVADKLGDRV